MSQFDRYQLHLVYLTMEHRPARNLQHETLQTTFDTVTALSPYTAQIFSLHFNSFFTFLEIIKHSMPEILHIFFRLQY